MSQFQGFYTLEKPADLLQKLRHDFIRMKSNPTDVYAAFDFFVTADHLVDWVYPDSLEQSQRNKRTALRMSESVLRVVHHLSNGAKHFVAIAKHHKSVAGVDMQKGPFDPQFFDPSFFDTGSLIVELGDEDAKTLGAKPSSLELAMATIHYWDKAINI
jgi:hypothetical protein